MGIPQPEPIDWSWVREIHSRGCGPYGLHSHPAPETASARANHSFPICGFLYCVHLLHFVLSCVLFLAFAREALSVGWWPQCYRYTAQHNTTNTWQSTHIYIISMVSKAINMHIHKQPKCGLHIHRAFAIWPATALKKQKCITVLRIKWLAGWLGTVFTI